MKLVLAILLFSLSAIGAVNKIPSVMLTKEGLVTAGSFASPIKILSFAFGGSADCTTACTTGNCYICRKIGDFTTITFFSTGAYYIYGINGLNYNCVGQGIGGSSVTLLRSAHGSFHTSTYHRLNSYNTSGGDTNSYGVVHCFGY